MARGVGMVLARRLVAYPMAAEIRVILRALLLDVRATQPPASGASVVQAGGAAAVVNAVLTQSAQLLVIGWAAKNQ